MIGKEILTMVYMSHLHHVIISHAFSLYSLVWFGSYTVRL